MLIFVIKLKLYNKSYSYVRREIKQKKDVRKLFKIVCQVDA